MGLIPSEKRETWENRPYSEARSGVKRRFGFGTPLGVEQLVYWVQQTTFRVPSCPSLMSGEDVNGDSLVSAMRKLNGRKD